MGLFLLFVSHGLSSILSSSHNHDRLFVLMVVFIFYTAGSLERELTKCRSLSSQCLSTPQQVTAVIPPAGHVTLSFSHPYWDHMPSTLLCSTFSITSTGNKICTHAKDCSPFHKMSWASAYSWFCLDVKGILIQLLELSTVVSSLLWWSTKWKNTSSEPLAANFI